MSDTKPVEEEITYAFDQEDVAKLKAVSARLNSPRALSFDNRRDLANLIDLLCSRAVKIDNS